MYTHTISYVISTLYTILSYYLGAARRLLPISVLGVWIWEGLTQAEFMWGFDYKFTNYNFIIKYLVSV